MAREERAMITYKDAFDMINIEGYIRKKALPFGKKVMTKSELDEFLEVSLPPSYSSFQLVPYDKISIPNTSTRTKINLNYNKDNYIQSCAIGLDNYFYLDKSTFSGALFLYLNSTGSGTPNKGYYSDGIITRYWDGSYLQVAKTCDGAYETEDLRFSSYSAVLACTNYGEIRVFMKDSSLFRDAFKIYDSFQFTTPSAPGWYSDGQIRRQWTGTNFTGSIQYCL